MYLSTLLSAALCGIAATAYPTSGPSVQGPGLKWYDPNLTHGTAGNANHSLYKCYSGPAANFPPISKWMTFNKLFAFQKTNALLPIGDSPAEVQDIYDSIVQVSKAAKVDARLILAVIVTESTGNVRVACTNNGVNNCGLMQSHNGTSFDPAQPKASILKMIQDGTQGTPYGDGFVQLLNNQALTGGNIYKALRAYNSGRVDPSNLSRGLGATPSYVSNVANYLQGWQGYGQNSDTQKCNFPTN